MFGLRMNGISDRRIGMLVALALSVGAGAVGASSDVRGTVTEFRSPGGATEHCIALDRMPGGVYAESDSRKEEELCAIDFYGGRHGLCPKVFSTSPGTLIYDLAGGPRENDRQGFERTGCSEGGLVKKGPHGEPISYKMSVNGRTTSATFANSSLIYYHFARYFDTSVHVPVAVFRSMDRHEHQRRVSAPGLSRSGASASLKMNHSAWQTLIAAEKDPKSYTPTAELFTPEGLLYGVMLHPAGKRYSEEINGTRASGWGDGQNRDFQQTAPYRALRSDSSLADAIAEGRDAAFRDSRIAKATGKDATPQQMVFWMSDLIDITLLDFIFSQQDRIGNIDYVPYWFWVEEGQLLRRRARESTPPADLAARNPVLLKRTELGDNDAGVRMTYANYAKRTGMLDNLRHYRAETYERLMRLHRDFASQGPLHAYVGSTFGLSEREFARIVENTAEAARILHRSCTEGQLRFDVEPEELLLSGEVSPRKVDCGAP